MRNDCGLRIVDCGFRRDAMHRWSRPSIRSRLLSIRNPKSEIRNGISLIEILISMFVLLFGLMGVASIFPVGSHYMTEGEKFDFSSALAQNAFEELQTRGMLRPKFWYLSNHTDPAGGTPLGDNLVDGVTNLFVDPIPNPAGAGVGPGHAFVIDPMGGSQVFAATPQQRASFPWNANAIWNNPWNPSPTVSPDLDLAGTGWPVRRITLPQTAGMALTTDVAETIFSLRDDLAIELPDEDDQPGIQRWSVDGAGNLLTRQYQGNYSWMATVVPTSEQAILGLQPANTNYGQYAYDVSVVVFRKRDLVPSEKSERLIDAQILNEGELAIFSTITNPSDASAAVDAAVEDIRPGNWIAVMGVHQSSGNFLMKWYRLLSLDDETDGVDLNEDDKDDAQGRYAMITGPDWPTKSYEDLRAAILPGAISVVTRQMRIED